jgi:murein DD-endopeptidase MepM/ murein hydrolase activator NlpD
MALARPSLRLEPIAALLLLAAGCATVRQGVSQPAGVPRGAWYVVEQGDTLATIAARHGVYADDLAEINGLRRDQRLLPGQRLFLLESEGAPGHPLPSEPALITTSPRRASAFAELHWPVTQPRLSSAFGTREGRPHEGIDLAAPMGTPIRAALAGQVLYAGNQVRGYGNMVVVQHPGDLVTVYAHASVLLVRTGQRVQEGQEVARVGQSGRATGPHLHFEVRRGQVPQDPLRFLPPTPLASSAKTQ